MPKVIVPLAQGCEELEAVTIIDVLRRAGIEVVTVGLDAKPVVASRGVKLIPDTVIDDVMEDAFDMIILPGGLPGSDNLNADARIHQLLQRLTAEEKYTAAICAAPKVLATAGLLDGRHATSYPGVIDTMHLPETKLSEEPVIVDGKVVTSRGPGTAMEFALTLVALLAGNEMRQQVEAPLLRV